MIQKILSVLIMAMLPVVERGAIPYGISQGLSYTTSYIVGVIGNMLPVPLLIIFSKRMLEWLAGFDKIGPFFAKIIKKADEKSAKIGKYELMGLFVLSAIPLPGTGAWTGALIAATLRLRVVPSFIAILLGIVFSSLVVSLFSWLVATGYNMIW